MIWKRHYFKELTLFFIFILFISYCLYALIDYTTHGNAFFSLVTHSPLTILLYYLYQFSIHAEILIPIALLLATLKVVLTANVQREFLTLLAAGISLKGITRPFLLFAFFVTCLCYLNFEYVQPTVYLKANQFKKKESPSFKQKLVNSLLLEDLSLLIYQRFDPDQKELFDLLWQKNKEEFYKIETLHLDHTPLLGEKVDYLVKDPVTRQLHLQKRYATLELPELILPDTLASLFSPPEWKSLSELAHALPTKRFSKLSDKQAAITTYFFYKVSMPLSALIVVLVPLIWCTNYSRQAPHFMIYALSLFGYITLFTLLKTSVIFGENQILHPALAICLPLGGVLLYLGYKYAKL